MKADRAGEAGFFKKEIHGVIVEHALELTVLNGDDTCLLIACSVPLVGSPAAPETTPDPCYNLPPAPPSIP